MIIISSTITPSNNQAGSILLAGLLQLTSLLDWLFGPSVTFPILIVFLDVKSLPLPTPIMQTFDTKSQAIILFWPKKCCFKQSFTGVLWNSISRCGGHGWWLSTSSTHAIFCLGRCFRPTGSLFNWSFPFYLGEHKGQVGRMADSPCLQCRLPLRASSRCTSEIDFSCGNTAMTKKAQKKRHSALIYFSLLRIKQLFFWILLCTG